MINILIVDDHEIVGEGTRNLLLSEPDFQVDYVRCSKEVIGLVEENSYDIYLVDLDMPEKNGLDLTNDILKIDENARVLIFTGHDIAVHFNYLIDAGVSGFISKYSSKRQLMRAIWSATEGLATVPIELLSRLRKGKNEAVLDNGKKISLTQIEEGILLMVSKGLKNEEIAEELYMSKRNVERYLTEVFKKLSVSSRSEAIVKVKQVGLLPRVMV
ncbi:response regulator [Paraliobacillus sp. JSM ZJ581]|uniref:response regulator transcription factor n=1 Tax=Paraliobacillus sp. JSM ZJ581 TaxID=3342118 RepID=UPI0035A921C0